MKKFLSLFLAAILGASFAPLGANAALFKALIDLTTGVTGTLPVGNGGTGLTAIPDLAAIEALSSTGVLNRTGSGTFTQITIASGVWTPTLTNGANIAASTAYEGQYISIGQTVCASVRLDADPTAANTDNQIELSLPVASNFGAAADLSGSGANGLVAGYQVAVLGDSTDDRAIAQWIVNDVDNRAIFLSFCYQVI
jgi:hypothetical protein